MYTEVGCRSWVQKQSHFRYSLLEQDTIENVSKPIKNQKNVFLISFYATFLCGCYNVFEKTAPENMKKHLKTWAFFHYCQLAQIQPKSQLLFHKNLPPRDFSIMTLCRSWIKKLRTQVEFVLHDITPEIATLQLT